MMSMKLVILNLFLASLRISGYETTGLRSILRENDTETIPETIPETILETIPETKSGRPKMHTFFTPVSTSPDTELLQVWKKAWSDAGWEPVVLTLEDAKNHPIYRKFIEAFEAAEFRLKDYDRMCFLRWLAMASSGGGWMSDYDTLPLFSKPETDGHDLPNDGRFTCYSRHVPNLVSGSQEEWHRMAQLLLFSYKFHPDIFWSDMLALLEVHDTIDGYVYQTDSLSLEKVYIDELKNEEGITRPLALGKKCNLLKGMRAIHFSHADCHVTGYCEGDRTKAEPWINAWKEKCGIK